MDREVNDLLAKELGQYMDMDQPIHAKILTSQILHLHRLKGNIDPPLLKLADQVHRNLDKQGITEEAYIQKVMEDSAKRTPYLFNVCQQKLGLYDMPVKGYCPAGQIPRYGKDANCCMDMKEYLKQSQNDIQLFLQDVRKVDPQLASQLYKDWKGTTDNNVLYDNVDSTAYNTVMASKENMVQKVLEDLKFEESRGDETSNAYEKLGFQSKEVWLRVKYYAMKTSMKIEGLAKFIVNNIMSLRSMLILTLVFRAVRKFICAFFQEGLISKITNAWTGLKTIGEFLDKTLGRQWAKILHYGSQLLQIGFQSWAFCQLIVTIITTLFFGMPFSMFLFAGLGIIIGWSAERTGLYSFWQYIRNLILRYVGTVHILQATFSLVTEMIQLLGVLYTIGTTKGQGNVAQASLKVLCSDTMDFVSKDGDSLPYKGVKLLGKTIDMSLRYLQFPIQFMNLFMCWGIDALVAPFVGPGKICQASSYSKEAINIPDNLKDAFMAQLKTLKWTNPSQWHFNYFPATLEEESEYDKAKKVFGFTSNPTDDQIKKQYRNLSKNYHPDKTKGSSSAQTEINLAKEVLNDKSGKYKVSTKRSLFEPMKDAEKADSLSTYLQTYLINLSGGNQDEAYANINKSQFST